LEKRYSLQLQYLQTLLRQIPPLEEEDYVNVNAPISRPNLNPSIQGPYLFLPETIELVSNNGSIDSFASDLTYLSVKSSGSCCSCLGVLMIVYSDGKLEVLLEVEKPEARFKGEEINNSSNSLVVRTPRGKSILEEEEIQEEEEELPIFIVHETLDLGYSTECSSSSKEEELDRGKNWPIFKKDSLYEQENDLVWIYSKLGVQGLVLGKRIENVWEEVVNEKEEEEKEEEVDDGVGESQVYWVIKTRSTTTTTTSIVGLEIISDVYLGYSMIALTPLLQLVGVELNLRVKDSTNDDDDDKNDDHTIVKNEQGGGKKSYVSLLDTPFTLPTVFSSNKSSLSPPPLRIDSNPLENVTPNSLRLLGKQVETYQTLIRDLVEGVDSVQHRLELQLRELSRQLQSLKDLRDLVSSNEKKEEEEGGGGGASGLVLVERMNRVEENQLKLLERLDKTLQLLMEKHQGNDRLSSYEKKWFEELKRVEKLLRGGNGQGGLEGKAKRVQAMWQELKPGVEEIVRKKTLLLEESSRSVVSSGGGLGKSQIQGLESKLSQE
jgi:nucleoporin NUP82